MRRKRWTSQAALTMIELVLVVVLLVLVAAVVIPNFIKARPSASKSACISNLKQIDGAKEQWALENKKSLGTPVDVTGVNAYLKGSATPVCPANGKYFYNPVGVPPTCSLGQVSRGHTL